MVEEITHDHLPKKISGFHSLKNIFTPERQLLVAHNLDHQIPLEKIKLLIELKFMEKSAKTVKWVLDKVIFLFTCYRMLPQLKSYFRQEES